MNIEKQPDTNRENINELEKGKVETHASDIEQYIDMYAVPGVQPLTPDDVKNYLRTKELIVKKLPHFIQTELEHAGQTVRLHAASMIQYAPENERARLIKIGLENKDWNTRVEVARMIQFAPEKEKKELQSKLPNLIQTELEDENSDIPWEVAPMIQYAPENERARLIKIGLENKNSNTRVEVARMIQYAPEKEKRELQDMLVNGIKRRLGDKNPTVRWGTLDMIQYAPENERARLINLGFEDENESVQSAAVLMIQHAPANERTRLIQTTLEGTFCWDLRFLATRMIQHAPEDERTRLIKMGLGDKDWNIRGEMTKMIQYAPENERARLIKIGLTDENQGVQRNAARMIQYAPENERASLSLLIRKDHKDVENKVDEAIVKKLASTTPLYKNTAETFFKEEFEKTGSRTTLLDRAPGHPGKTLKGKVIVRHILSSAYLNWTKAFESHAFWKEQGFDYVPVEPILRARAGASEIAVSTRVLGPNVLQWKIITKNLFGVEIDNQVNKIRSAIAELGITHGHPHQGNFVLAFHKTANGEVDLSRPPRVYMIDFDAAISSPHDEK